MKDKPAKPGEVFNFESELDQWRQEYLNVRDMFDQEMDGMTTPEKAKGTKVPERRSEPRYSFLDNSQDVKIFAHMGPRAFQILNISIGGIAFYSEIAFKPGERLLMSALGMIALEVEVLDCEMEEVDADMMEYRYRVRARFGPMVNGYQVYVLAREMHIQEAQKSSDVPPPPTPQLADN